MKRLALLVLGFATAIFTQERQEIKAYNLGSIIVEGEVENPGPVKLGSLPVRSCAIKEVALGKNKPEFRGAYRYDGVSLYDILDSKVVRKRPENAFNPATDLYVIAENARGDKAVFSWGEVFYARDNFAILLASTVQAINPSKLAVVKFPLPEEPRIICANDLLNVRFLGNPTKLTVKSFDGTFATEKPKDIFSPDIRIAMGSRSTVVRNLTASVRQARYSNVGYGHGTGFKGIQDIEGFVLKEVLKAGMPIATENMARSFAVMSAKDGYRAVFSACELVNRNDNREYLLVDNRDSKENGRYTLYAIADFFVDRNVKSVEKIEISTVQ